MNSNFRKKLKDRKLQIGTLQSLPSPEITEIFAGAGLDWLFLELEHSVISLGEAQMIVQSSQMPVAIRVPLIDEVWIKKALDIGPAGIIVPQVQTADDAKKVVEFCKYPPQGKRTVGIARAQGYGENFQEYVSNANENTAVILMIEHINAVNNIEEILNIEGIDCLFIGPYDLSSSMGKTGQTTHPEIQRAIDSVKESADRANIPLGVFGATTDAVRTYIQNGYTLIAVSVDTMMLGKVAKDIREKCSELGARNE